MKENRNNEINLTYNRIKNNKIFRINWHEEEKDLHYENYKVLMKEDNKNTNKQESISCSWIRRINIIKMSILPWVIYRFSTVSNKIPMAFYRSRTNNPKICMEPQNTPKSQSNIEK